MIEKYAKAKDSGSEKYNVTFSVVPLTENGVHIGRAIQLDTFLRSGAKGCLNGRFMCAAAYQL